MLIIGRKFNLPEREVVAAGEACFVMYRNPAGSLCQEPCEILHGCPMVVPDGFAVGRLLSDTYATAR